MTGTIQTTADYIPSELQQRIFEQFAAICSAKPSNIVVRALAGTGKTSTIIRAINYIDPSLTVIVGAFGKAIQLELEQKLKAVGSRAKAQTFHSMGLACVMRYWPGVKINYSNEREMSLAEAVCKNLEPGERFAPDAIKKLVAQLCTKGRLVAPHATEPSELYDVAIRFELDPDEEWEQDGFTLDYVCRKAVKAMALAASEKPVATGIDGTDMIFLPVRNRWLRKSYDVVIVDEAQDMNVCQLEIAEGTARVAIVIVGDNRQAIFGFAGADSGSLDRMKHKLMAKELPLNVTYRCGHRIAELARELVPNYESAPGNSEGIISSIEYDQIVATARPGDFILSRTNAPLVTTAIKLLRAGKRTRVAGRNIGEGLVNLVKKLKGKSVPDFLAKLSRWEKREIERLNAKYADKPKSSTFAARKEAIHDQAGMLESLADGARNVTEIQDRVVALFTDDGLGDAGMITCSSVHRAKGLESDRALILRDTLRIGMGEEEDNIAYVAITRAKHELVWVNGGV